jgi:hypothetical protein
MGHEEEEKPANERQILKNWREGIGIDFEEPKKNLHALVKESIQAGSGGEFFYLKFLLTSFLSDFFT